MAKAYYEITENFTPLYRTTLALIEGRGHNDVIKIVNNATISVVNTEFDNWNGGIYGYTVYLNLAVKVYSSISHEKISEFEKIISDTLNETIKGDEYNSFHVQISPLFCKADTNWSVIGGANEKTALKQNIETIGNIMASVATGGARIQDEDIRYKKLNSQIKNSLSKLKIEYNNHFESLWDWYGKWKSDFKTYQERRVFISEMLAPTLSFFEYNDDVIDNNDTLVKLDEWDRIRRTVVKIKRDSQVAKEEEDFQGIGLLCREVVISLALEVYNPLVHGITDDKGVEIGKADAVRMLSNYINQTLPGGSNEELRAYAKNTNKLANLLTHKRTATKRDMLLITSATLALINFIGIIDEKY